MDWRRGRRSDNVVRASGARRRLQGPGGLGLGGIAVVVLVGMALGASPVEVLSLLLGGDVRMQTDGGSAPVPPEHSEQVEFVRAILGSTEDTWNELFEASGSDYPEPRLVLFAGAVGSACGHATSAVGPFYCTRDRQVYLDLQFFDVMAQRFRESGDLARAYVIAHEVGHHVQNVTGAFAEVDRALQRGAPREGADSLPVRLELQADCYAGVWANHSDQRLRWLEPGDVESALAAATAIGDDALQRQAQGQVVPDSFTHGTSEQRARWFRAGLESGNADACDTFRAKRL